MNVHEAGSPDIQAGSRPLSILLVEDSRVLAERLRETLQTLPGVELTGTVDCEADAIATLRSRPVDVMLLDLHLRQGTGLGVLRAIRASHASNPVVIVLTNYDLSEYREAAAALGVQHFLDKLREFERLPMLLRQISTSGEPGMSHDFRLTDPPPWPATADRE